MSRPIPVSIPAALCLVLGCASPRTDDADASATTDPGGTATGPAATSATDPAADGTSTGEPGGGTSEAGDASTTGDPPALGFVPDDGFHVSGELVHGGTVTITRDGGGLGTHDAAPWLWDVVASQWLAGVELGAYAGLADGDPITTAVWTDQGYYQGWESPVHKFKYTTDPSRLRHGHVAAHYGNYAASPTDPKPYSKIGMPAWPQAWGAQTNAQMYLSWWQRMDGATPGYPQDDQGNGGEDKPLRFGDTELRGLGEFDISVAGLTANTTGFGNVKSWGSWPDPAAAWHRVEFFVDRVAGIADLWVDGRLQIGSSWMVRPDDGGAFEFRPADAYLYVDPPSTGSSLDTGAWINVTIHTLGFDDGGTTQMFAPGRNVELSEIYLDTTRARIEIADSEGWIDAPEAERTAEVQGRRLLWTDDTVQFELDAGGFAELGGKHLWLVLDDGSALHVGHFAP